MFIKGSFCRFDFIYIERINIYSRKYFQTFIDF